MDDAVKKNKWYLGEGLHGEWPLSDQLFPARKRGQDRKEVIPQFSADVDIEVSLNPGNYECL